MNKRFLLLSITIFTSFFCYAQQDANFNNLAINGLTKGFGAGDYSGWGMLPDNTLDPRPNYTSSFPGFSISHHTGLTFSAHSSYGGIRFYNQGYPNGPYSIANGAQMVMSITGGNVGIGTTTPQEKLHINGNSEIEGNFYGLKENSYFGWDAHNSYRIGFTKKLGFQPFLTYASDNFVIAQSNGMDISPANTFTERLVITTNGNVGIGITTPTEKLSVNGKIRAKEIKVEASNWPDFVFKKDYKLPTLFEVASHIQEKGHLPGMPSAKEVEEDGVDLGEMQKKLLQKVEELTLYMLGLKKENDEFKENNRLLMRQIKEMQSKLLN